MLCAVLCDVRLLIKLKTNFTGECPCGIGGVGQAVFRNLWEWSRAESEAGSESGELVWLRQSASYFSYTCIYIYIYI